MDEFMTEEAIRDAFFEYLRQTRLEGVAYGTFWRVLHERGAKIPGRTRKNERDRVYRALTSDPRITKLRPGFFGISATYMDQ